MLHPLILRVLPSDLVLPYNRKMMLDAGENSEWDGSTTYTGSETVAPVLAQEGTLRFLLHSRSAPMIEEELPTASGNR